MLLGHDVSRLWGKLGAELGAPRSIVALRPVPTNRPPL